MHVGTRLQKCIRLGQHTTEIKMVYNRNPCRSFLLAKHDLFISNCSTIFFIPTRSVTSRTCDKSWLIEPLTLWLGAVGKTQDVCAPALWVINSRLALTTAKFIWCAKSNEG